MSIDAHSLMNHLLTSFEQNTHPEGGWYIEAALRRLPWNQRFNSLKAFDKLISSYRDKRGVADGNAHWQASQSDGLLHTRREGAAGDFAFTLRCGNFLMGAQNAAALQQQAKKLFLLTVLLQGEIGIPYNVSSEKTNVHLRDFARFCAEAIGKKVIFDLPSETEKKGYSIATKAILENGRIKKIGFEPVYEMSDAVSRTIEILKS